MAFQRLRAVYEERMQQLSRRAGRFDDRFGGRPGILWSSLLSLGQARTSLSAAAIAYFALLSVFPLALLSIAIASYSVGPSGAMATVINQLEFLAPMVGDLLGQNIAAIVRARGSVSVIALFTLMWSASVLFRGLGGILQDIWHAEYIRPSWQRNGVAVTLILLFVGPILIVGLLVGSIFASISNLFPEQWQFVARGITAVAAIVLNIGFFLVVYGVMPHGTASFRDLLPGAVTAGVLWEGAKRAFVLFVGTYMSRSNLVYGSVASIIAFLTWAYFSGMILLFGAYISVNSRDNRVRRHGSGLLAQDNPPPMPDRAPRPTPGG